MANHIGHRQYTEPIKTRSNYMWLTQSAGKSCERVTIGFGFTSDWMKRWRESFKPIASCRKCKTNYFSTLKWKPLYEETGEELSLRRWAVSSLKRDENQFSPNKINTSPRINFVRVNKLTINGKMLWSFIKFSPLILTGNEWRSVWRIWSGCWALTLSLPNVAKGKFRPNFHISFSKILTNK